MPVNLFVSACFGRVNSSSKAAKTALTNAANAANTFGGIKMRKVMLLAAILAVFVTMLVSTSWAEVKISPVISDPSGAPAVTPIHQGANRHDPESGAPD